MNLIFGITIIGLIIIGIIQALKTKEPDSFYLPGKTVVVIGKEKQSYTFREGKISMSKDGLIRVTASDGYEKTFNKNSIEEIHIEKY